MQGRIFKGRVLLVALVVLANVSDGELLRNSSCANDDDQALLQARVNVACNPDETPPVLTVPADIVVNNDPGLCAAVVNYAPPTAADNCAVPTIALTDGPSSGASVPVGSAGVTFTATDEAGNTATGSFTVTVIDSEPPVPTVNGGNGNIEVPNDPGVCGATVGYPDATATDNCAVNSVVLTSGLGSGTIFPVIPVTSETWTATDSAGNAATSRFTVKVNDVEAPALTVPASIVVDNDPGQCAAVVNYAPPTATDNCAVDSLVFVGLGPGSSFPVGTATEDWTATDTAGNTATGSFTVKVNDNEDPALTVPANIVVDNDPGLCAAVVNYAAPTATDNCAVPTIALTGGPSSGASVPVGSAGVTFTATDAAGNTAIRSFSVQVNDNDPPTLEVEDVDVNSCTPTVVTFSPAAADNCPGATAACSPSSGSEFPVGETEVTCTAVDAAGKTTQESFVVLVKCDGHGYYKKSHGNNIRKRRNPHMKKWLHYWDQYRR